MTRSTPLRTAGPLALLITLTSAAPAAAQDGGAEAPLPPAFDEPIPLYETAVGEYDYRISTDVPEAEAYFGQGVQMMYAFTKEDAARSFREAWRRDPDCAICYWGEAWSWGSYLNGPMRANEAPHAYAAIQRAVELAEQGHADARERALIDAMAVRYVEDYDPGERAHQDSAYARAMAEVHAAYPNDLDIATLYAEALFLLLPRRGTRDLEDPDVRRLHGVLEATLAKDVRHPGACHLYIHATESTSEPERAEACAEFIGSAIPGASHINHMPSHTWNEVGRWGDAVRANIEAWQSDLKAGYGEGFAIYPSHNLHMLLFAGSMDGQGAVAMQAGRDYTDLTGSTLFEVLTLVRFGRFEQILEVEDRPEQPVHGGMWDFAQGYAHLRSGSPEFARAYLQRVLATADTTEAQFRFHSGEALLGTVGGILEGELHRDAGDLDAAIASFERAVELEDGLTYDEPEPLPFAARHWLGSALLEAGRYAEAEAVYRAELEDHPHNGWSLFGLQRALTGQGKTSAEVDRDFAESWGRSDTWLRDSRF
jgi:tetratricopeptide (TPR) repeat protein